MAERQQVSIPIIENFVLLNSNLTFINGELEQERQFGRGVSRGAPANKGLGRHGQQRLKEFLVTKPTVSETASMLPEFSWLGDGLLSAPGMLHRVPPLEITNWVSLSKLVVSVDPAAARTLQATRVVVLDQSYYMPSGFLIELTEPIATPVQSPTLHAKHLLVSLMKLDNQSILLARALDRMYLDVEQIPARDRVELVQLSKTAQWGRLRKFGQRLLAKPKIAGQSNTRNTVWSCPANPHGVMDLLKGNFAPSDNNYMSQFVTAIGYLLARQAHEQGIQLPDDNYDFEITNSEDILKIDPRDTVTISGEELTINWGARLSPKSQEITKDTAHTEIKAVTIAQDTPRLEDHRDDSPRHYATLKYLEDYVEFFRRCVSGDIVASRYPVTDPAIRKSALEQQAVIVDQVQEAQALLAGASAHMTTLINQSSLDVDRDAIRQQQAELLDKREVVRSLKTRLAEIEEHIPVAQVTTLPTEEESERYRSGYGDIVAQVEQTIALMKCNFPASPFCDTVTVKHANQLPFSAKWWTALNNRKLTALCGSETDGDIMQRFLHAMEMSFAEALERIAIQPGDVLAQIEKQSKRLLSQLTAGEVMLALANLDTILFTCCDTDTFSLTRLNTFLEHADRGLARSFICDQVLTI